VTEERLGEDWKPGMRVQYWSRLHKRTVEGVIAGRSWGRDRGTPTYYLEVDPDEGIEPEVLTWNQVTWPEGATHPATVMVRGKKRSAVELGRHHGRVYLRYRLTATGPESCSLSDADHATPRTAVRRAWYMTRKADRGSGA
jgi:hypothetical protein